MPAIINDEGVSEIIAILLIIVVTILIAGIFASYSFNIAQDLRQQSYIAITVDRVDSSTISVMNAGGNVNILDSTALCPLIVRVNGNVIDASSGNLDETIGSFSQFNANTESHIVVVGLCNDGSSKVLFDDTV